MTNNPLAKTWDQRLFSVLWIWLSIRTILPWLVFFRLTFEGNSYSWGTNYFGRMFYSSGLARPDFLLVYALLVSSLFLMYQLRKHNFRLAGPLLIGFLGIFAADAAYQLMVGEPIIFHGDTLGVKIDLTTPFFIFQFGMFAIALAWWMGVKSIAQGAGPKELPTYKKIIVKLCIALVPVQLILLIFGEPHALTDEIGVLVTILQWLLLAFALYPGSNYRVVNEQMHRN
jgi:hypothetical protein